MLSESVFSSVFYRSAISRVRSSSIQQLVFYFFTIRRRSSVRVSPPFSYTNMDFTKFMNKFNEIERQLSPTSALRLSFDNISPESEEPDVNKRLWGVPVPPFVSDKVVNWIEEEFNEPPIFYNGDSVIKKVFVKLLIFF